VPAETVPAIYGKATLTTVLASTTITVGDITATAMSHGWAVDAG